MKNEKNVYTVHTRIYICKDNENKITIFQSPFDQFVLKFRTKKIKC